MALFLQGAGGDISEPLYKDVNRPRDAEPRGTMLALSTLKALRTIKTGDAELSVLSEHVELPRRTDIPRRIEALKQEQDQILKGLRATSLNFKNFLPLYLKHMLSPDYPSDDAFRYIQSQKIGADEFDQRDTENRRNIEKYLANIRAMEKLAQIQENIATLQKHQAINEAAGSPAAPAEIMGIKIGDCAIITAPFEALVEIGLRMKAASPHPYTFMAAFSNGYYHYGAPADYYDKGGYEVTECLLAPEWQAIYEAKALEILHKLS